MENKSFNLEVKEIKDDGIFEGYLSIYNNIDYGYDMVLPGAFTKSIKERPEITMLYAHETKSLPIGIMKLEDTDIGLKVYGEINLETQMGKEVYSLLKQKALKGLSIGYDVIDKEYKNGIRHLKELDLWEGSIVVFPMNPESNIYDVKEKKENKELEEINNLTWQTKDGKTMCIKDFNSMLFDRLEHNQLNVILGTLESSIYEVTYWSGNSLGDKNKLIKEMIKQFQEALLMWVEKYDNTEEKNNEDDLEIKESLNKLITNMKNNKEDKSIFEKLKEAIS